MSLRALGRQFQAQLANRNKPWMPGTEAHPQGQLFDPGRLPKFRFDPDVQESARRRMAGENNPDAPWEKGRIFQHHFLGHDQRTGRPRVAPVEQQML